VSKRGLTVGIASGAAVLTMMAAAAPAAFAGHSAAPSQLHRLGKIKAMYDVGVHVAGAQTASAAAVAGGLKSWSKTVSDGGSFTYRMVGKDPTIPQAVPSTTIKTALVPVIIKFTDGSTWDPTVGNSCDATSAVARTMSSPMVKSRAWTFGGTSVGTGQYSDAFQRANFYTQTNPAGINPGYHVKLAYNLKAAVTINVPAADAAIGPVTNCGKLGAIEINWLDSYIKTNLLPPLSAQGFGNKTLPVFLLGNVVEYIGTTANCCVLGYHNATSSASTAQTYSVSMYDNTGLFTGSSDVSVLSHEVAEWLDDPFTVNPTKPWGHVGQVTGCQANLEVGDPLSGTVTTVTMNSKVYHLQELAFVSWFYHQTPSTGVHGWYSNLGTFTSAAASCV
jgi:hypothetical protein